MIISAGAPSLGAFFVGTILMWLCGNFFNALAWGGGFFLGGLGNALKWFNGGRGKLGDFGRFIGDFGIKFGERLKIVGKKFAYV